MSITVASVEKVADSVAAERIARASVAFGRKRGYFRLLFDAGPVDAATFAELAGVTERLAGFLARGAARRGRVASRWCRPAATTRRCSCPASTFQILLGDHGEPEFEGARALLDAHRDEVPPALAGL